jgi:3-oxoacyl-[acyl-carrier-protein] synthase III
MPKDLFRTKILGMGSYFPERILTNHDLENMVETSDQWIVERTGISSRRIAAKDQVTTDLALNAARDALKLAKCTPEDLDLIIFATASPDQPMPSAACILQHKLGCRNIMAFDLAAACSGFVYALTVANQFIRTGQYKRILVIGAEILSRYVNYEDRETCILFGDGAGAAVLGPSDLNDASEILSSHMAADGSLGDLFTLSAGGSAMPFNEKVLEDKLQYVRMKGREIFKSAVRTMSARCEEALQANNLTKDDITWLIPHQANKRIIEAVGKHFGIEDEKVIINLKHTGNTSAATIPTAMTAAINDGRIKRGDLVLLTAFGAGLTSGSLMLRY